MSEFINNREVEGLNKDARREKLKALIIELHNGRDFDEVKKEFEENFGRIAASEISQLEQEIIAEGMPVSEVQRLCDVHSAVFKGSIDEIHGLAGIKGTPGHPLHTFIQENNALKSFLMVKFKFNVDMFKNDDSEDRRLKLIKNIEILYELDKHYLRKENLLFPYLEKYGVYGPAKVMWGVDDEIRLDIKNIIKSLKNYDGNRDQILEAIASAEHKVNEMIFKEENILFPLAEEMLTQDEWLKIQDESKELGYTLIDEPPVWVPKKALENVDDMLESKDPVVNGQIKFETGVIDLKELEAMLNTFPVDITFIDKDDVVKYFSHGKERVFPRTKAVIGRTVQNCHPPGSVHIVDQLVADFKSGKKDFEDFWIHMRGMYVLIRYFAVRDEEGNYMGTLEFTQNIKPIQEITGEKRLMNE
jgi:uncharacterized protein